MVLALPRNFHCFLIYSTTRASTFSGFWCGTRRMENLPITFLGIILFQPGSAKAPSIP